MTFIIALGVIIILLCSASVLKLIQPKSNKTTHEANRRHKKRSSKPKQAQKVHKVTSKQSKPSKQQPVVAPKQAPVLNKKAASEALQPAQAVSTQTAPKLISITLMSDPKKPYSGYELLQSLLSCGLRFGQADMFHRHAKKTGVGPVLFSLAACTKEGTFDLSQMGGFQCPGLVLFMKPQELTDPVLAFEALLETADQLISALGGKVLNSKQQLLTKEDVMGLHQQLQTYMQDRQTMDLFH